MTNKNNSRELTTNQVVNSILNNDFVTAKNDVVNIMNNLANHYLDIHKIEVAQSLFQREEIEPEKDDEYVNQKWWQVRKGIKDQPQSKDKANSQLKGRVGKMSEEKTMKIAVDDIDSIDKVLQKFDHDIINDNTISINEKDYVKFQKELKKHGFKL